MNLVSKSEDYISQLFKDSLSHLYLYHNIEHTKQVVAACKTISQDMNLEEEQWEKLLVAAWFHDAGYIKGRENHENRSMKIAADFLKEHGKSEDFITEVNYIIAATEKSFAPQTTLQKIIRDADFMNLGSPNYFTNCEKLRKEWQDTEQTRFSDSEWNQENLTFLESVHVYYTEYGKENLAPIKRENIAKIRKYLEPKEEPSLGISPIKKKKTKDKSAKSERAIDTVFRVTLANHTRLSGIADSKANILLSVNAIIISIALSTIIPKLDSPKNAHLVIPTMVMLFSSVVTIIFAILSTRPKVTKGLFSREDIENKKVNLLFFGNFYKMPIEEYEWAMKEMLKDSEYSYSTMIKDLYYLGIVLEKKYRLLRITYNFFMFSIILSVLVFVWAFVKN